MDKIKQWAEQHPALVTVIIGLATLGLTLYIYNANKSKSSTTTASVPDQNLSAPLPPTQSGGDNTSTLLSGINSILQAILATQTRNNTGAQTSDNPITQLPLPPNRVNTSTPNVYRQRQADLLISGPQSPAGQKNYYITPGTQDVNQIASLFGLKNNWTDIAYNPHNQTLDKGHFLSDTYMKQGKYTPPQGTLLWIPISQIPD